MFNIKDRELVIPGQLLGMDVRCDLNCYSEGTSVYSLVKGMARIEGESVSVMPSAGGYSPKAEDTIVGIVTDENIAGWVVDIDTAYECFLRKDEVNGRSRGGRDDRRFRGGRNDRRDDRRPERREEEFERQDVSFKIGEVLSAKILSVDEVFNANLTRPWKLSEGMVVEVNPKVIPRLIGKKQSMLTMIKEKTGCKIVVGQNGLVWIKGENAATVTEAIRKIEREAQTQGLTDRISVMLSEKISSSSSTRVDEK